jgi:ubiquinone/menaquinone biosynthesis C-methylase UbiE
MLMEIDKRMRRFVAEFTRGRFPGLYSTLDEPLEVPVQAAAYRLAVQKYMQPGDRVLDVGFGLGYGLRILAQKAESLTGIDIDQKAVSAAASLSKTIPNLEIMQYDGTHIPYPDKCFNIVTCIDVVEHVPDYLGFINELIRVSNRVVVLSTPNRRLENTLPDGKPKNFWHLREWSFDELAQILNKSRAARWEANFINGSWGGPFTYSSDVQPDTQALAPALLCA